MLKAHVDHAVAGKPGSGTTQFVKDLLAQIRQQSEFQGNLVFFDSTKGDGANDATFIAATRARVVRLPEGSSGGMAVIFYIPTASPSCYNPHR